MQPRPQPHRIVLFVAGGIAGILVPVVIGLLLGFLGPSPYLLDDDGPGPEWSSPRRFPDGTTVHVRSYASAAEAAEAARSLGESIPASSSTQTLDVLRYTRADDRRRGLLLPVERHLVHVEAADDQAIDDRLQTLPFVRENPEKNLIYVLFTEHLGLALLGLALYSLAYLYFLARAATWAAEVAPAPGVSPVAAEELRSRILGLNDLDLPFQLREERGGRLVAEWRIADARWAGLLELEGLRKVHRIHMELDPRAQRVRSLDEHLSVSWSAGVARLGGSASWFRGITFYHYERGLQKGLFFRSGRWTTTAYDYRFLLSEMKSPLVEVVTGSGWRFSPVLTLPRRSIPKSESERDTPVAGGAPRG